MLPSSKLLTRAWLIFVSSAPVLAAFSDPNGTWRRFHQPHALLPLRHVRYAGPVRPQR